MRSSRAAAIPWGWCPCRPVEVRRPRYEPAEGEQAVEQFQGWLMLSGEFGEPVHRGHGVRVIRLGPEHAASAVGAASAVVHGGYAPRTGPRSRVPPRRSPSAGRNGETLPRHAPRSSGRDHRRPRGLRVVRRGADGRRPARAGTVHGAEHEGVREDGGPAVNGVAVPLGGRHRPGRSPPFLMLITLRVWPMLCPPRWRYAACGRYPPVRLAYCGRHCLQSCQPGGQ
jgi:hypothetical protein